MDIRSLFQKNALWIAAVIAVVAIVIAARNMGGNNQRPMIAGFYFYDLGTGKVFAADAKSIAPIDTPSGAEQGVKAAVFSCSSCDDESSRFVAYLSRYTSDAKAALTQQVAQQAAAPPAKRDVPPPEPTPEQQKLAQTIADGMQVALVPAKGQEPQWVPQNSTAGAQIISISTLKSRCTGDTSTRVTSCEPAR